MDSDNEDTRTGDGFTTATRGFENGARIDVGDRAQASRGELAFVRQHNPSPVFVI
jgi:hypothetical protein